MSTTVIDGLADSHLSGLDTDAKKQALELHNAAPLKCIIMT